MPSDKGTQGTSRGKGVEGSLRSLGPPSGLALTPPPTRAVPKARISATFGFNPCVNTGCGKPAVRPLVDTGAMVFVVFGIIGLNRTQQMDNHVIGDPVRPHWADVEGTGAWPGSLLRHSSASPHRSSTLRELCSPGGGELTENYSGIWVHLGTHTGCLAFIGGLEQMRGILCEACPPLGWALCVDVTARV